MGPSGFSSVIKVILAKNRSVGWWFTTSCTKVCSVVPVDGATGVAVSSNLQASFSEPIALTGAGSIILRNLSGGSDIPISLPGNVTIAGALLTIDPPSALAAGDDYAVEVSADAIRDLANPPDFYAGLLSTASPNWSFTVAVAPLRIMPMGDSITVGYTNADWTGGPFEFGYRSGLYTLLTNTGYHFQFVGDSTEPWTFRDPVTTDPAWPPALNLATLGQGGHNGYAGKTASFLNANILSWLASQDPDLILLKIGTNSQDQAGLQTLVNTITTTKPDCHLIIARIMPKYTYQQGIVDYNTWIRDTLVPAQQALGRKVTVVDQYAPFLTNPADLASIDQSLFSNEINHPSNPGYDKMAQVWFDAIESLGLGPETYSKWIGGFPGVGGETDLNDDPDRDGVRNGVENFFGTAPDVWSTGIVVGTVDPAQGTFTFTHPQGVLADDLCGRLRMVEGSANLSRGSGGRCWWHDHRLHDPIRQAPAGHHYCDRRRHRHPLRQTLPPGDGD